MTRVIKVSVRALVEWAYRAGDLVYEPGPDVRLEAAQAHRRLQASRPDHYLREVPIRRRVDGEGFILEIGGRMDGLWENPEAPMVEEIKTTDEDPALAAREPDPRHLGQARMYAAILAEDRNLDRVDVQLVYLERATNRTQEIQFHPTRAELDLFFRDIVGRYLVWIRRLVQRLETRDESVKTLGFPHGSFRSGQRDLAAAVFRTIRNRGRLLAESPTGVGKTLATLFPAVKAQGLGLAGPVFYLTARTTGQGAAEKALNEIGSAGGRVRWVTLTAKEKICPQPDVPCHPNFCSYAKGYFDRLSAALEESFGRDDHPASVNQETAHRHGLCPFEWSLDLALTVDVIVADYNYAFDPRVYLRRFFDFGRDYVFLVDEAHQLVDRARAMFSARIVHSKIRGLARDMAHQAPDVAGRLWDLDDWLSRARNRTGPEGGAWADSSLPEDFLPLLSRVIEATTRHLGQTPAGTAPKELVEFLVDSLHLTAMASGGEENGGQAVGYETNGDDLTLTVFCLDPSRRLARAFRRSRSVVLFSATLTPPDFYQTVLGLEEDAAKIRLASPFPMENLKVLVADRVSTRYRDREKTLALVTKLIRTLVEARPGHYLAFFPSHSYLEAARMDLMAGRPSFEILVQTPEMPETGRAAFLDRFHASGNGTVLGLAALGGIFGEGIDLAGDRLTGAVVVGVGLPGLGLEQNLIRDHYETRYEAGFEYAALFPGMRRVRQAAGRVIRSETDRGVVLLVDDRFGAARYRDLFPPWWTPKKVRDPQDLARSLTEFWNPIHPLNADSR